jgi:putative ABC transport system permease protein
MADLRATNRAMFWRILRRLFSANRGRLFVMLLALGAGAAVTAALLNLQVDAKRRLTIDFRAFGPNFVVAPQGASELGATAMLRWDANVKNTIRAQSHPETPVVPFLYLVANVQKASGTLLPLKEKQIQTVVVGTELVELHRLGGSRFPVVSLWEPSEYEYLKSQCFLGERIARRLGIKQGDRVDLLYENRAEQLRVLGIISAGGEEDDQIFVELMIAQRLSGINGQASLIQVSYPGTPKQIDAFYAKLASQLPNLEVRPVRQFTEGEAKIYNRISGLLTATVGIVLLLTALCVMAAMTNVAMERKMDVGLMKAIGGSMRRVLRLFLAEAALLGLAGGVLGAAAGIFLSIGLGKAVFGVAARPRLIVYPVAVALTIIVAIISAFPLRRLASIRPASVFRGEA